MRKITPSLLIPIFIITLFLISINFILLYSSIANLLTRQDRLTHSLEITTNLEAVFSDMNQAEISEKNFVLTGDDSYLGLYNEVGPDIMKQFNTLKLLTKTNLNQQKILIQLQPFIQKRLSFLDKAIKIRKAEGTQSTQQIKLDGGKSTLSQIRTMIDRVEDEERTLFQKQDKAYQQSIIIMYSSFTTAIVITAFTLGALYVLFKRDLQNRMVLEQRKDDFLSTASHELKTPLTSMKIYTQLLQKELKENNIQTGYAIKVEDQVNKLIKLVANLLDTSKIQAGKLDLQQEHINVTQLVIEVVDAIQMVNTTHRIQIIGKIKAPLFIDKDRVEQVFTNLLANAIKYSPNAKKVVVTLRENKTRAYIEVKDFGVGITENDRKKVFHKFFRAKEQSAAFPGFGMGLYISYQIMKLHGGNIEITSQKGKGSCFTMVFLKEKLS